MLIACNSLRLLNLIALVVPTTIAATYKLRPMNVTTDKMLECFRAPPPFDDFSEDPAGDELVRVQGVDGPLETELYLRTAHFELAGLDRWSKARPNDRESLPGRLVAHRGEVAPDLPVHDLAQPQPAGHGLCGILRSQNLRGEIHGPDYLQEG